MISEKMNAAFNKQIKDEMYSSNLYLSMVAYFEEVGLKGSPTYVSKAFRPIVTHKCEKIHDTENIGAVICEKIKDFKAVADE